MRDELWHFTFYLALDLSLALLQREWEQADKVKIRGCFFTHVSTQQEILHVRHVLSCSQKTRHNETDKQHHAALQTIKTKARNINL